MPWIDFNPLVQSILSQARDRLASVAARSSARPKAVVLLRVGENLSPSQLSAHRYAERVAESVGVSWRNKILPQDSTVGEVIAAIRVLNYDQDVVGIVASRPMETGEAHAWWSPKGPLDLRRLHQAVHPLKDVEGVHPISLGQVVYSQSLLWPCTARASLEMAALTRNNDLRGLEALVIGHGDVVAKPLFSMLQARGSISFSLSRKIKSRFSH